MSSSIETVTNADKNPAESGARERESLVQSQLK